MRVNKKIIAWSMTLIMLLNLVIIGSIPASAHDSLLDVEYDPCDSGTLNDGMDETWYIFSRISEVYHIDHEVNTIKYYFELEADNISDYVWTDVPEALAEEVKTAYANSMKKWNNVCFYSYNSDGSITKNKVINVVEGTKEDHNLSIYPAAGTEKFASTGKLDGHPEEGANGVVHTHYSEWYMRVYIDWFDYNSGVTASYNVDSIRDRTGAHEIGHVLGLGDVDKYCTEDGGSDHHQELLMGYGLPIFGRASNITYKDIAGVAITRGFHTDDDHQWLYMPRQGATDYKLVCWICNGVKYVDNLADYPCMPYDCCEGDHDLSDGNMRVVASYGNQDYYKCRYCRYVAPFSRIVTQDYTKMYHSDTLHKCVNNVDGLEYTFYEEHSWSYVYIDGTSHQRICECGASIVESHTKVHIPCNNNDYHLVRCACGYQSNSPHVVNPTSLKRAPCILCGAMVTIGNNTMQPWGNDCEESLY